MAEMTQSFKNTRVQQIIDGVFPVTALDLSVDADYRDFEAAVSFKARKVLDRLNPNDPDVQDFLYDWINHDPNNVLKLNPGQYFGQILEPYFYAQMKATQPVDMAERSFTIQKTLEGNYSLLVDYQTHANEEIRYIDSQLRIPTIMTVRLEAHMQIFDMFTFLAGLGIDLASLTYKKVELYLNSLIVDNFRPVMMNALDKKQIGYYSIASYYHKIADAVMSRFESNIDYYGIAITHLQIREVNVPKTVVQKMENTFYAYRQYEQRLESDLRYADLALGNYERKAAIHAKYPNFPVSATEAEKDLALNRMLKKMQVYEEPNFDVNAKIDQMAFADAPDFRSEYFKAPLSRPEKPVAPVQNKKPDKPKKPKHFGGKFLAVKTVFAVFFAALIAGFGILPLLGIEAVQLSEDITSILPFICGAVAVLLLALYFVWFGIRLHNRVKYPAENEKYFADMDKYKLDKQMYKTRAKNREAEQRAYEQKLDKYRRQKDAYEVRANLLEKPEAPLPVKEPKKPGKPKSNSEADIRKYNEEVALYARQKLEYEKHFEAYAIEHQEYLAKLADYNMKLDWYSDAQSDAAGITPLKKAQVEDKDIGPNFCGVILPKPEPVKETVKEIIIEKEDTSLKRPVFPTCLYEQPTKEQKKTNNSIIACFNDAAKAYDQMKLAENAYKDLDPSKEKKRAKLEAKFEKLQEIAEKKVNRYNTICSNIAAKIKAESEENNEAQEADPATNVEQ